MNQGGGMGIPGLYTVYEHLHTWRKMIREQRAVWIGMLGTKGIGTPLLYEHLRKDFHERGSWRKIFVLCI